MVRTMLLAAAVAVAGAALAPSRGFAEPPRHKAHRAQRYICTAAPPEFDPRDLNQMRASVSASSRLALAIREREFLASCRPLPRRHSHPAG